MVPILVGRFSSTSSDAPNHLYFPVLNMDNHVQLTINFRSAKWLDYTVNICSQQAETLDNSNSVPFVVEERIFSLG